MKAMVCRFTVQRAANMISCSSVLMTRDLLDGLMSERKLGTEHSRRG